MAGNSCAGRSYYSRRHPQREKVEPEHVVYIYNKFVSGLIQSVALVPMLIRQYIAAILLPRQDLACVHESSIGQLQLDLEEEGLL